MGWTGTHKPRGQSYRDYFQQEFWPDGSHTIVESATLPGVEGRVFYAAVRERASDKVWGLVVLIHGGDRRWDSNITYKEMTEDMGPYEVDAPARVLDRLTPTDSKSANEWRQRVRDKLAQRAATPTLSDGDVVEFEEPLAFANGRTLSRLQVHKRGRKTWFTDAENPYVATTYRVSHLKDRKHRKVAA